MRCTEDFVKQRVYDNGTPVNLRGEPLCGKYCRYFDHFENSGCTYRIQNPPKTFLGKLVQLLSVDEVVKIGAPCIHPEVHRKSM